MTAVVASSAVVAALIDRGPIGEWARRQLRRPWLAAPSHLFVEVSGALRRHVLSGAVSRDVAALAHRDLVDLPLTVFPFEPFALRVWELHPSVTPYDAAFVALAEGLDVPVVTLDGRLALASGPTCEFRTPN